MKSIARTGAYGVAIQDGKILLIRQYRGPYAEKYDLPGGKIEAGESAEMALHREFAEEVAMEFRSAAWLEQIQASTAFLGTEDEPCTYHHTAFVFVVKDLAQLTQPSEYELYWVPVNALADLPISPLVERILGRLDALL